MPKNLVVEAINLFVVIDSPVVQVVYCSRNSCFEVNMLWFVKNKHRFQNFPNYSVQCN